MKPRFERARKALDFLEAHQLDPSPANFEFALRYVASPASELAAEIDEQTFGGLRLTQDAVLALAERHCSEGSSVALDRRERTVARQAEELGTLTSDAHNLTEALGRDVGAIAKRAGGWPPGAGDLGARLSDAERELAELRDELKTLREAIGVPTQAPADVRHDELTRALNPTGASVVLEPLVQHGRPYTLVMFIIDDLLGINNRFGRTVGDNVVKAFAATLHQIFAEQELIRWSGNEFLVAAHFSSTAAQLLAEEALTSLRARRLKLRGTGEWIGKVTASAGIVVAQGETQETVLARVRARALSAAAQGGDRVQA